MILARALILMLLAASCVAPAMAEVVPFPDADMESPGRDAWETYGTPVSIEKVRQAHSGQWALRVQTDNKETMGGGFEGVSRTLGELRQGDRVRVSFWLRPLAGREVWIGMGRTSFEQIWRPFDTDWMQVVCDFRARADGTHSIWITQQGAANDFLLDDFRVERIPRLALGQAPASQRVAIGDSAGRVWLCRETGALCGIENLATGETVAPLGERQPLFSLSVIDKERQTETIGFDRATLQQFAAAPDGSRATLSYAVRGLPIRVTLQVMRSAPGEIAFSAEVENRSDRSILEVTYPLVYSVRPAADPKALTLVHPYLCGQIQRDALRSAGCDSVYPGRAVMGWFDLYGEKGGLSLSTRDTTRTGTRLTALPAAGDTFDMSLSQEVVIRPNTTWTGPRHVLLIHAGDWHIAADRYREWARQWLGTPDVPRWIQEADGWVLMGVQNGVPFWRIPDVYRSAEWMGVDYLHVQGQAVDNMWFDADGKRHGHAITFLYPSPRFGTPEQLRQAVRDIHSRGGHVMFYFLYERWTPSHSVSDDLGTAPRSAIPPEYPIPGLDFYEKNALVERPGARPPKEHPFMVHRMMCLGSPGWQEWMRHWAIDVYAKRFEADGFYWDVMGRNGPFRCFNEAHGHQGENRWAAGSAAVLERTVREGRAINPDYSCAIEGCQDALAPWVGFHLMSGATQTPEVFRYTFPELCLVDGFSNHYWKWTQVEKARRVFLCGERFDLHGYHAQVRKLVWLRKRLRPFIDWPARFVDTIGVATSDPAVQARRFVRDDGGNRAVLITLLNEGLKQDATITVDLAPMRAITTAHLFTLDGRIRPLQSTPTGQGKVSFTAPAEPVAGVLFVDTVDPALRVVPVLEQIQVPDRDGLELTLFYPAGRKEKCDVRLRAPAGVTLRAVDSPRPEESPAVERRAWEPEGGLASLQGWEKIHADLQWPGGKTSVWSLLCPPLVNGDMERLRPDGHLAYWPASPSVEEPAQGKHCLKLEDQGQGDTGFVSTLTPIKPGTRYRLSARIKRDTAGSDTRVAMIEYEEGSKFHVSASVGAGGKANEWQEFTTEFTSHPSPRSSAVYLYRGNSKAAWFDQIELVELK
ncbi:MAG: hypothetical protein GX785_18415 [Armatimonadetes bacterium]|nr:hypothetical protein [Armatimonadota bacterium]HOM82087.1 DUF6259 domain-containing protein [Armatimonadota bacterium]HPO73415.1 DUF6259 domain-containing protein [Armatimonadota bacterium]